MSMSKKKSGGSQYSISVADVPDAGQEELALRDELRGLLGQVTDLATAIPGLRAMDASSPEFKQMMGFAKASAGEGLAAQRINLDESLSRAQGRTTELGSRLGLLRSSVTSTGLGRASEEYLRQMGIAGHTAQQNVSNYAMALPQMMNQMALGKFGAFSQAAGQEAASLQGILNSIMQERFAETKHKSRAQTTQWEQGSFMETMGQVAAIGAGIATGNPALIGAGLGMGGFGGGGKSGSNSGGGRYRYPWEQ